MFKLLSFFTFIFINYLHPCNLDNKINGSSMLMMREMRGLPINETKNFLMMMQLPDQNTTITANTHQLKPFMNRLYKSQDNADTYSNGSLKSWQFRNIMHCCGVSMILIAITDVFNAISQNTSYHKKHVNQRCVCLSICHMRALWQNQTMLCGINYVCCMR